MLPMEEEISRSSESPLVNEIERGRQGFNIGLSMGFPKLEDISGGILRKTITLVFAKSGVGKSTFAYYAYIYKGLCEHLDDDMIEINLFSFEIDSITVEAKLMCMYIYDKYDIRLTPRRILGMDKSYEMDDDVYSIVIDVAKKWMEKVRKKLHIFDYRMTSEGVYRECIEILKKNGTFDDPVNHKGYHPHNRQKIILSMIDHMGLLNSSGKKTKKEEIDHMSQMEVGLRNRTGMSFVNIMQINRSSSNMDRKKNGFEEPIVDDIKESGGPAEDSDTVFALYNPKEDHLSTYRNAYDVTRLGGHCISVISRKNRYGITDVADVCFFDGMTGIFQELPEPDRINYESLMVQVKGPVAKGKEGNKLAEYIKPDKEEKKDNEFNCSFKTKM